MTDPAIRSRNIGNKRKGANFEIALTDWFRGKGFPAERISRKGNRDEGDVSVEFTPGCYLIVEAKNAARLSLAEWFKQANVQAERFQGKRENIIATWPVVIVKRRNHGIEKSYVVMELDAYADLLP
jgi:Holliday junction resolvase